MSPEPLRDRLSGAAREVGGRLPAGARRRAGRVVRRVRAGRPQVSAVVLALGTEDQVRVTLDAVRDQPLAQLEIVVVVMDERLQPLADAAAAEDWRVRTLESYGSDWGAARQFGSVAGRGRWLLFLSPRQLLLPGAVEALLAGASGPLSIVLGGLEGEPGSWTRAPLLGRLLVPRDLWARALDDGEPDGQSVAVALLSDTYGGDGYGEAGRDTLRHTSTRTRLFEKGDNPIQGLSSRVAQDRSMLASLERPGLEEARTERAAGALVRDLPRFVLAVEHCADRDWQLLHLHVAEVVGAAGEAGLSGVPLEDRVALWLAAEGRREELTRFVAARRFAGGEFPTAVESGSVLARFEEAPDDVPDEVLTLGSPETAVRAQVRRSWVEGEHLCVELFAGLRRVEADSPEVRLWLRGTGALPELPTELSSDPAVTRWMGEPHQRHDAGVVLTRIPLSELTTGSWQLELAVHDRGVRRTGLVGELEERGSAGQHRAVDERGLRWTRTDEGLDLVVSVVPPEAAPGVVVRRCEVDARRLVLAMSAPSDTTATLSAAPEHVIEGRADGDQWTFELTTDPWGLGRGPAPTGTYRLAVTADGAELPVSLAPAVLDRLPVAGLEERHRTALWRGPAGGLLLRLDPALGDDEAGPWAQRQLQRAYAEVNEPLDPHLVYFQAFLGQSPTDHPGAIQAALHRALRESGRTGVRMLWAVSDASTRVPHGAEPVLLRSRAWYAALTRAASVVTCIELDPWFTRREGQQVLETYHGYPSKAMGLSQWRQRGLTPTHLQQMLQRTSGSWNNLLTPIPEMDRYYRDNYAFDGRIISAGYPRDDSLVAAGHEQRRVVARQRLGIAPHQRAILYAPTWRDDQATNFRSARAVLHLDVERAAHDLGPDYVFLMRGHRFHAATRGRGQVVDVTSYPEVNDLILASDAAVLDYSSLRFDYALTGRPMAFLVPDLRDYTEETRGFLFDFARSAPGPLLESTDEVVAMLADLPALQAEWGERLAEFNAFYNRLADGRAAERVVAEFFGPLLAGEPEEARHG